VIPLLLLALDPAALMGQIDPARDPAFLKLDTHYLRKETHVAFVKMREAAQRDGVRLVILSATRTFTAQKAIWERKWNDAERAPLPPKGRAESILRFSSMPGTSRHHWGTDLDLNSLNNSYFATGEGKAMYAWMTANASRFGFCQPYTEGRAQGYEEEKWHWSYTPLAAGYLKEYNEQVKPANIAGFAGADLAETLGAIPRYVNSINPSCR
jgi:LAS superfamily LD-carboxypeptidase LdcB